MTLVTLASLQAAARPNDAAFVEGGREISYAELDALGRRAAAWLRAQGIVPGDRVALWFPNRIEWLALLSASPASAPASSRSTRASARPS